MQGIKVRALGKADLHDLRHLETAGTKVLRTEKQDWLAVVLGECVSGSMCKKHAREDVGAHPDHK